jgi:hypothetical protein
MTHSIILRIVSFHVVAATAMLVMADDPADSLRQALTFHASFDHGPDADFAKGDIKIYTSPSLKRTEKTPGLPESLVELDSGHGRWGSSLRFKDVNEKAVWFHGGKNVPFDRRGFGFTVSFWMSVDPERGLKPGYVDPLQITDKEWNNACLFVDFTKDDHPRHFRLGVFSDFAFWNPKNIAWDDIAVGDRPMVDVANPPFAADRWTHVAFAVSRINDANQAGQARFFLDGKFQGQLAGPHKMTWDPEQLAIILGIQYIGHLDDFAIFDRPLDDSHVKLLQELEGGVAALRAN